MKTEKLSEFIERWQRILIDLRDSSRKSVNEGVKDYHAAEYIEVLINQLKEIA